MVKIHTRIFFINIVLILLIVYLLDAALSVVQLLNITFYFFLVYMVLALFLYTLKGGFYDGVAFGFRRFLSMVSKDGDPLEAWEEKPTPSTQVSRRLFQVVLFQWLALAILLGLLFAVYYIAGQ
ncbi:protein of unknown function [Lentibacillus persicus]|uniref:DUF3899 domain-containing protein n=1 Tax=Lentibacillus persicus TaxID=640948 RepID=A0A1I1U466_9BACI|nr:DUF3899 domain-containing protein [Lentibacillus persicus]SFD65602.1 protein of unknown function [Lentibacillus persicus]